MSAMATTRPCGASYLDECGVRVILRSVRLSRSACRSKECFSLFVERQHSTSLRLQMAKPGGARRVISPVETKGRSALVVPQALWDENYFFSYWLHTWNGGYTISYPRNASPIRAERQVQDRVSQRARIQSTLAGPLPDSAASREDAN